MSLQPLEENRPLLRAFRRGEPEAFAAVFTQYAPRIAAMLRHGFAFNSGGRTYRYRGARMTADLEDRLHDVFERAFREQARMAYDGLSPYERYLSAIARNLIIDDLRKKEHALIDYTYLDEVPAKNVVPESVPPEDAEEIASNNELISLVARFKTTLNPRELQVYALRFEEGLMHKDIAEKTGLSESKIKTSERRIRERFFTFMKKHGYFAGYGKTTGGWLRSLVLL